MSRGKSRRDGNGLTPSRYWKWIQSRYPVIGFLEAVGTRLYPKSDGGPVRGERAIKNGVWRLDCFGRIPVVWASGDGPRVGGRTRQFKSIREAIATSLADLGLEPDDFVLPPASSDEYPEGEDFIKILAAIERKGSQPPAAEPLGGMRDPLNEPRLRALLAEDPFTPIHRKHATARMRKGVGHASRRAAMEDEIREALRPLRHDRLENPVGSMLEEVQTFVDDEAVPPIDGSLKEFREVLGSDAGYVRLLHEKFRVLLREKEKQLAATREEIDRLEARLKTLRPRGTVLDDHVAFLRTLCGEAEHLATRLDPADSLDDLEKLLDDAEANKTAPVHQR